VGTRIEVLHLAATPVARQVVAGAQVTKVDGRRIEFKIEATEVSRPLAPAPMSEWSLTWCGSSSG